jgi:acetoin:2,6-dichlorophenolindophenol oxidoreductase subunit beta
MMNVEGDIAADREPAVLGRACVVRPGTDVTLVATQLMRVRAEEAAETLAQSGVSVEIVDPRTLVPLDVATVIASLERTGRLLVVQESPFAGSWGATMIAAVTRDGLELLDAPPAIVCGDDTPVPYAGVLEDAWLPTAERVVAAVEELRRA